MAKLYNLARMSTGTTGTGTITLGSAVAGFLSFAAAGVGDGETVTYAIQDGSNSEIGRGVYTASGTTLTRSVLKSTNSGAAINLSGTAQIFITASAEDFGKLNNTLGSYTVALAAGTNVTANRTLTLTTGDADRTFDISASNVAISAFAATILDDATAADAQATLGVREVLTENRTYYVNDALGSDSNTGLSSGAGAFKTIQKAVDITAALDLSSYNVTINVAAGTYSSAITLKRLSGGGSVTIVGDTSTPSNVIISATSAAAITVLGSGWTMNGFKTITTTAGSHIVASGPVVFDYGQWDFGAAPSLYNHVDASAGGYIRFNANYTISGGAACHWSADQGGAIARTGVTTITLTGTPAFASNFAFAYRQSGILAANQTFSGSATGARYNVGQLSIINTFGGGATYLPGDAAGTVDTASYGIYA